MLKLSGVKLYVLAIMVAVLSACSGLGLAPAQSPSQGIAYAYGEVAAVRSQAASALQAGTISVATAQKVLTGTDTARATLDAAQVSLASGDTSTVAGALASVNSMLVGLQALLPQTQGVK